VAAIDYTKKIQEGLQTLGATVPDEVIAQSMEYLDFLLAKNKKVNLTGIKDRKEAIEKHLIDSLALLPVLDRIPVVNDGTSQVRNGNGKGYNGCLMDVGSGGGLPGIPIKCARSDIKVTLVEAKAKKVRFLKEAIQKLGLKGVKAYHHFLDPECPVDFLGRYDWIVSRASLSITDFARNAILYKKENGTLILMKGPKVDDELEEAAPAIQRLGLKIDQRIRFQLPFSKAERAFVILR